MGGRLAMGCDIHLYVEKQVNNKWVFVNEAFWLGRNYWLFAILADVRNMNRGCVPITRPKGIPNNVTSEVQKAAEDWRSAHSHSHSYLTLAEIVAYNWTQIIIVDGILKAHEFYRWNDWGREDGENPDSWITDAGYTPIEYLTEPEMLEHIEEVFRKCENDHLETINMLKESKYHIRCQWTQPYYKMATEFWSEMMPRLLKVATDVGGCASDVRIVFWFDN
ncbi:MAG: hypothetical protein FWG14_11310 [Peptococcaceae bacterium]|nr:hypothetical protein [Peptococcaceae bacterium]